MQPAAALLVPFSLFLLVDMKASYCIEGRIHNHKLMDTIIVMGSANIRHNNENEKRFFFWLSSSSYFVFSCMKQKDLLICQEPSTVFKIEQKRSILIT